MLARLTSKLHQLLAESRFKHPIYAAIINTGMSRHDPSRFKTDALARVLALRPSIIVYRDPAKPSVEEIERETARLNALPADQQMVIACQALGFDVVEYLTEKAKFNYEVEMDQDDFPGCVDWQGYDA